MEEEKLYCTNCDAEITEEDTFCPECGAVFVDESEVPKEIDYDEKTTTTIDKLMLLGAIYKWILIIVAILYVILSLFSGDATVIISTIIIAGVIFACSFLADVFTNWLALMLKNVYEINNKLDPKKKKK